MLANNLITFFINGKPTFIYGQRSLARDPPNCIIPEDCVFEKFILAETLNAKT